MRRVVPLVLVALACGACGARTRSPATGHSVSAASASVSPFHAHPQAIEPTAGAVPQVGQPAAEASVSVGGDTSSLPQPTSNAAIRAQLAQSGISANPNVATLAPDGLAIPPINAPPVVQEAIQAGNEIARLPYIYGGGHATYEDTGYDCSGSISFVFDAAGLLKGSVVSGQLENWGDPGPGKWITVFANAGHTFMYVAGLRFDTVALAQTGSRWSTRPADEPDLRTFSVRHPPGL